MTSHRGTAGRVRPPEADPRRAAPGQPAASPPAPGFDDGRRVRASIRRDLLLWLLLPLVGLVPLAAAMLYAITVRPALESLDRGLGGTTVALANLLVSEDGRVHLPLSEQTAQALRTDPYDTVYFVASDAQHRVLAGDAALAAAFEATQPELRPGDWLRFDAALHGQKVRVVAYGAPCPGQADAVCPVLVAESVGKRAQAERHVLVGAMLAMLCVAIALIGLGHVAISRGLRPLHRLGDQIERRSFENLQPVDAGDVPREAAPLVDALNRLLDRLRVAAQAQQAFIADAAHQLRTPLTALHTESELALLEPHAADIDATLRRLHRGSARAVRMAHQLLALARADHAAQSTAPAPVNLQQLLTDAAQDWIGPALQAGQDLGFELHPAWVVGRGFLLRELVGNLLHNAHEYAGRGARVTLRVGTEGASGAAGDGIAPRRVVLEVEDNGPGIAEADRERVWGRFQRGVESGGAGSGLGLAIVADIARSHGGRAELLDGADGHGLVVRVTFPAAPA